MMDAAPSLWQLAIPGALALGGGLAWMLLTSEPPSPVLVPVDAPELPTAIASDAPERAP